MNSMHPFDRYSSFTDLSALLDASSKPLRKCMRVNTLKCTTEEFKTWAKTRDWMIDDVPWCKQGFFVDREDRSEALGKDLLHVLGYVYMQEASSMLPVMLLSPKPGETVLDMSAAPGSKTTQIGALMEAKGKLISNDVQEKRIWSLLTNIQRCGVTNTIVTRKVGQWFSGNMTEVFDRVLCDAPCTAQGTARKDSDALKYCSLENVSKMSKLQKELLESAVHAARVGGTIVYSTCTLTPEENEQVVMHLLAKYPTQLRVIDPTEIPELSDSAFIKTAISDSIKVQENLTEKGSNENSLHHPFIRLWPQTADTEGFFSALIQKIAPTKAPSTKDNAPYWYNLLPDSKVREVKARLLDWYGTPFLRDDEVLLESKEQLLALDRAYLNLKLPLHPYYSGIPFGKYTNHGLVRLSHEMATLRGREATKQVLHVPESEMRKVLAGVNVGSIIEGIDDGDVLLALEDNALLRPMIFGRGMLKSGSVLNRLPRDIVKMFT